MMGECNGEFSKTILKGHSAIPDSDCTNNSTTGITIPRIPENERGHISQPVTSVGIHTCSYVPGKTGNPELKIMDLSRNPDMGLIYGDLDCHNDSPSIPRPEKRGNSCAL